MPPFEPDPGKAADAQMTYGEHARKMTAIHKILDAAIKRAEAIAPTEAKLAEAEAKLATMPDAAKSAKRLERAERERDEATAALADATSEYTTEKALLTAGITDADDMALVRHKFGLHDGDDFSKYLAEAAPADRHLAAMFAPPPTEPTEPPATSGAPPPPPPTNGGVRQPPPPGKTRDLRWLAAQPTSWKNDPNNWPEINQINGVGS